MSDPAISESTDPALIERVARALHEAHKPWCDYTYPFEHPLAGREVYEALATAAVGTIFDWMQEHG